jgi:hypothetical protein
VINRQDPLSFLHSLASRKTLKAFSTFVSGTDSWDNLGIEDIGTHSIEMHASSADSEVRSSEISSGLKAETSWYFDADNLKPGAPGWKLEREISLLMDAYEKAFPQDTRLKLINDPASGILGSEGPRKAGRKDPLALAAAESCAWKACVLSVLVDPPPFHDLASGQVVERTFALDPREYMNASPDDKARLLQSMYPQFMVCHATAGLHRPAFSFQCFSLMVQHWLHMIYLNGELPEIMSGGSVRDCFIEDFEEIEIDLAGQGYRAKQITRANLIVRQLRENKNPE